MDKLKFMRGNAKLGKDIYTFSLPAGYACPGAEACLSKADKGTGKITDGPRAQFRCFAASQEAVFTSVRMSRWGNYNMLKEAGTKAGMRDLILRSLTEKAKTVRIHVSGDMFNAKYFDAWVDVANARPDTLFYAYTKSIATWVSRQHALPENLILTASYGSKYDTQIARLGLPSARVIFHPDDAGDLPIDHDDSHAQDTDRHDFTLLLHGTQAKGSEAAAAIRRMKNENVEYEYSTNKHGSGK